MGETKELAEGYDQVNSTQYKAGLFLLERLAIVEGLRVLDVGCGTGNLAAHITSLVGQHGSVTGLDPSEERINIANERKTSNLAFQTGMAEDLSRFPESSFDIVFVNSTLHWVLDQPAAIKEFGRVLKPGGRLGISGASGDFVTDQERIKEAVLSKEPFRNYPESNPPKFLGKSELQSLLDAAGFAENQFIINKIVHSATDAEGMIHWLDTSSSGKLYGDRPVELRPGAREEMKKEWQKLQTPTGIHMTIELLVTVATMG